MDFDKSVNRRNTGCIKWDTVEEDVLPFGIADMDFELPREVKEEIKKRIEETVVGYTFPDQRIYNAIIKRFKRAYHVEVKKEWIMLISGIVPAFKVIGNMSKELMINIPNYNMLLDDLNATTKVLESPLVFDGIRYKMNFEEMEQMITDQTDTFFLVNPNNPVGKVYSKEELIELSEFSRKHGLLMVCDEAHCDIVFEGSHTPLWSVDDYTREHSITLYSTGKSYNMAGLPFAFMIIPNEKIREQMNRKIGAPNQLFTAAAVAAYNHCDYWLNECMNYLSDNKDYMENTLATYFPKAKVAPLEGTYLMWVDFTAYFEDPYQEILEKAKVKFNAGTSYHGGKYVRINIATQKANLIEAMERIKKIV